jgi:hypothetical protein
MYIKKHKNTIDNDTRDTQLDCVRLDARAWQKKIKRKETEQGTSGGIGGSCRSSYIYTHTQRQTDTQTRAGDIGGKKISCRIIYIYIYIHTHTHTHTHTYTQTTQQETHEVRSVHVVVLELPVTGLDALEKDRDRERQREREGGRKPKKIYKKSSSRSKHPCKNPRSLRDTDRDTDHTSPTHRRPASSLTRHVTSARAQHPHPHTQSCLALLVRSVLSFAFPSHPHPFRRQTWNSG